MNCIVPSPAQAIVGSSGCSHWLLVTSNIAQVPWIKNCHSLVSKEFLCYKFDKSALRAEPSARGKWGSQNYICICYIWTWSLTLVFNLQATLGPSSTFLLLALTPLQQEPGSQAIPPQPTGSTLAQERLQSLSFSGIFENQNTVNWQLCNFVLVVAKQPLWQQAGWIAWAGSFPGTLQWFWPFRPGSNDQGRVQRRWAGTPWFLKTVCKRRAPPDAGSS